MDLDVDRVGLAGQRLVDRVVDDLPHEVVQAARTRRPDVHAGSLAHRLETLEDGDVLRVIAALVGGLIGHETPLIQHDAPAVARGVQTGGDMTV